MKKLFLTLTLLLLCAALVSAEDKTNQAAKEGGEMFGEQEMPPMGPPEELKEMSFMIGEWNVKGKMRTDPTSDVWSEYAGVATYEWVANGAALMSTYESEMFGMAFIGHSVETYDRETKQWQVTWFDSMSGRQSMYTGNMVGDDKMVVKGEDKMAGMTFKTRITVHNMTEKSYDWMLEHSMDGGATWATFMDAHYTKKM